MDEEKRSQSKSESKATTETSTRRPGALIGTSAVPLVKSTLQPEWETSREKDRKTLEKTAFFLSNRDKCVVARDRWYQRVLPCKMEEDVRVG